MMETKKRRRRSHVTFYRITKFKTYSASKEEINMLKARGNFSQSELPW